MNTCNIKNIPSFLKSFKGAILAINTTALIIILAIYEFSSPSAYATQSHETDTLGVCLSYAEQGTDFSSRFKSCASILNIKLTQRVNF